MDSGLRMVGRRAVASGCSPPPRLAPPSLCATLDLSVSVCLSVCIPFLPSTPAPQFWPLYFLYLTPARRPAAAAAGGRWAPAFVASLNHKSLRLSLESLRGQVAKRETKTEGRRSTTRHGPSSSLRALLAGRRCWPPSSRPAQARPPPRGAGGRGGERAKRHGQRASANASRHGQDHGQDHGQGARKRRAGCRRVLGSPTPVGATATRGAERPACCHAFADLPAPFLLPLRRAPRLGRRSAAVCAAERGTDGRMDAGPRSGDVAARRRSRPVKSDVGGGR